ncbi:hypothetical protein RGQ21_67660 [Kitasatospora aureofaciens]|nr:hypothetical protein RGQ21_67660 [Kitasatospora aureofaciens]
MFCVGDEPIKGSPVTSGGHMLQLITSQEASADSGDVLKEIYGGKVETTQTWVETGALLITEVTGQPFGQYFMLVITDAVDEDDVLELHRLAGELGKNLCDCVVERERVFKPHPFFPGSKYFDLVTVYGG